MMNNLEYSFGYAFINNFHTLAHILAIYLINIYLPCASYPVQSDRNKRKQKDPNGYSATLHGIYGTCDGS